MLIRDFNFFLFQKPNRLCKYCNTWNSHLTRHLKRKHKDEEEVVLALKLPKKDQEKAFGALKREGIFMANMKRLESDKSAPLIRERSQGTADTVLCSGCRGFYDAKSIFKHKRLCEKNVSDLSKTIKLNELSDNATLAGVDGDLSTCAALLLLLEVRDFNQLPLSGSTGTVSNVSSVSTTSGVGATGGIMGLSS